MRFSYFSSSIILLLIILVVSCNTLDLTQIKDPEIVFEDNVSSLTADGQSWTVVKLIFQRPLSGDQEVNVSTTSGDLFDFPISSFDEGGAKSLKVYPRGTEYLFVLKASKIPDDNVLLNVTLNGIVISQNFTFLRVCPDEILLDLSDSELVVSLGERSVGVIKLFNNGGIVSDGTRIDITLAPNSLATVEPRIFYSENEARITIVPTGMEGELTVTATIAQNGCNSIEVSKLISIREN